MPNEDNHINEELNNLRETIRSLRDYQAEYHNHKENMAWAATGAFAAGIFAIIGFIYKPSPPLNCWGKIALFIILVISFLLVLIFIDAQLCARQRASKVVGACISLEFKLIRGDINRERLREFLELGEITNPCWKGLTAYPVLIETEIDELDRSKYDVYEKQKIDSNIIKKLSKVAIWRKYGLGETLKYITLFFIVVWSLITLLFISNPSIFIDP